MSFGSAADRQKAVHNVFLKNENITSPRPVKEVPAGYLPGEHHDKHLPPAATDRVANGSMKRAEIKPFARRLDAAGTSAANHKRFQLRIADIADKGMESEG